MFEDQLEINEMQFIWQSVSRLAGSDFCLAGVVCRLLSSYTVSHLWRSKGDLTGTTACWRATKGDASVWMRFANNRRRCGELKWFMSGTLKPIRPKTLPRFVTAVWEGKWLCGSRMVSKRFTRILDKFGINWEQNLTH